MTSTSLIHEAAHSKLVLWDTQRDGVRRVARVGLKMVGHVNTHG